MELSSVSGGLYLVEVAFKGARALYTGMRSRQVYIDGDWLADRLTKPDLGFDAGECKRRVDECLWGLRTASIFDRDQAEYFFAHRGIKRAMIDLCRVNLKRDGGTLDPSGYCSWGARLFMTPRRYRPNMRQFIGAQLAASEERRQADAAATPALP